MEHQSQFGAAGAGLNGTAKLGHKNILHSYIDVSSNQNLASIAEITNPLVPLATLGGFTNSEEILRFSPQHIKRNFLRCGKKHKLEDENHEGNDCPPRKKKLTNDPTVAMSTRVDDWGQDVGGRVVNPSSHYAGGNLTSATMFEVPCEEMEQTVWEQQPESARRTLQEIEDSLTCDEEVETEIENSDGRLPRLVLSDALKEELKRDFTGGLTNKIVGSFSPSMELVLWKPPPMLDAHCHKFSKEAKGVEGEEDPNTAAMTSTFLQLNETLSKGECITTSPTLMCNNLASACDAEEEMELMEL
ncbi:coiled-coil domain-containing protein 117-like isoform X2 [Lissotriton helveticus]